MMIRPLQNHVSVEDEPGTWSTWFNTDNPYIYDRRNPGGDQETLQHIVKHEGRHCDWGVQCLNPIAMEVDISVDHKRKHKMSNLEEVCEYNHSDSKCRKKNRFSTAVCKSQLCYFGLQGYQLWRDFQLQKLHQISLLFVSE